MQPETSRFVPLNVLLSRVRFLPVLVAIGSTCALPALAQTYDATADYSTNLVTGTNPNGVWTYGWSSSPTAALNLYTLHHNTTAFGVTANAWNDPAHIFGNVPLVYKNTGADYSDVNVIIPANALILHGGGPNGSGGFENDFSHVVFTAPSTGNYALASTFQLRQQNVPPASVQVRENGVSLFNSTLSNFLDSTSYSNSFLLNAGDKLDFEVGFASTPTSGSGNSVELSSTLVRTVAATPEPGPLTMILGTGVVGGMLLRRRRSSRVA